MDIPGSDLLGIALGVIDAQPVTYYRNSGRTTDNSGRDLPLFADPVPDPNDPDSEPLNGSVQAVPRSRYALYGLDVQKSYVTWFIEQDVIDIERDVSGDRITYAGRLYQLVSATDWFGQDGWVYVICVDIGNATNAPYNRPRTP